MRQQGRFQEQGGGHSMKNRLSGDSKTFQATTHLFTKLIRLTREKQNKCVNGPKSTTSGRTTPWHFSHFGTSSFVSGLKISCFSHLDFSGINRCRLAPECQKCIISFYSEICYSKKRSEGRDNLPEVIGFPALSAVG